MGGLGGYIYALDETSDNILMNFSFDDPAIFLARIGYCFTLLFGLPLITLPCRESLRAVPGQIRAWRLDAALAKEFSQVDVRRAKGAHLVINGVDFDELDPILVTKDPEKQHQTMLMLGNQHDLEHVIGGDIDADNETAETVSEEADTAGGTSKLEFSNRDTAPSCRGGQFIHCVSTLAVVGFCYSAAVSVPSVGFVWSLCGSSMAIIIAFIIPTACYLKIREHKQRNPRSIFSWMLLIISMIAAPICTQQAIVNA